MSAPLLGVEDLSKDEIREGRLPAKAHAYLYVCDSFDVESKE